ncbi:hypothetical protein B0H67DRAFT_558263 [Lasiosphaeris hirsuta]|uniref:Uncharacterized protein n=1 Tax=Lasiosphaeris hirsuta TaxID=260670 RepID=A0AA40DIJ2_9PEZI|nr:hypothetical protein B0H67DRAFT_558263 [Lasiosphaeris hirsuta]
MSTHAVECTMDDVVKVATTMLQRKRVVGVNLEEQRCPDCQTPPKAGFGIASVPIERCPTNKLDVAENVGKLGRAWPQRSWERMNCKVEERGCDSPAGSTATLPLTSKCVLIFHTDRYFNSSLSWFSTATSPLMSRCAADLPHCECRDEDEWSSNREERRAFGSNIGDVDASPWLV